MVIDAYYDIVKKLSAEFDVALREQFRGDPNSCTVYRYYPEIVNYNEETQKAADAFNRAANVFIYAIREKR